MTNLQQIRKERGLSQRELAELSGVNLRMVQKYESGEKNINHAQIITLFRLSKALGIGINAFAILLERDEELLKAIEYINTAMEKAAKEKAQKEGKDLKTIGKKYVEDFNRGFKGTKKYTAQNGTNKGL